MNRLKLALPAVALMCALAASPGQAAIWLGGSGGVGMPTSDFGDAFKSGWNIAATGDFMLTPMWGIGGDLGYMAHNAKDEVNDAATAFFGVPTEITTHAMQYTAHATFVPPVAGNIRPYLQAGVGAYSATFKVDAGGASADESKTKFGWNGGGGVLFETSPTMALGVDAHYHNVDTKDDFGANFTWFAINGRIMFKLP
jgi:opacity protein-like surface antigen